MGGWGTTQTQIERFKHMQYIRTSKILDYTDTAGLYESWTALWIAFLCSNKLPEFSEDPS